MPTLILSHRHTEDSQRLWRAAAQIGWRTERTSCRLQPDLLAADEPVVYMEALVAPTVAEAFGITLREPPNDWLPNLPMEYLNRQVCLSTLGEARKVEARRFVKPPNDKSFPAAVYRGSEIPDLDMSPDSPVLVSEIVAWEKECRCFILDREVRTFSMYLRGGELQKEAGYASSDAEDAEVLDFCKKVLADLRVDMPRAVVMDVGVITGRGWSVVELNAAWGSGLYGCDPAEALEVIRHACVRP